MLFYCHDDKTKTQLFALLVMICLSPFVVQHCFRIKKGLKNMICALLVGKWKNSRPGKQEMRKDAKETRTSSGTEFVNSS